MIESFLAGYGYPSLFRRLEDAIADISSFRGFSRLIVTLDSEHRSVEETAKEVTDSIEQHNCPVPAQTATLPQRRYPSFAARTRTCFPSKATANARTVAAPAARSSAS
ncbi:MAG: hypothetical protein R3B70_03230 [Polyangiaceae bacterium]